MKIALKYLCLAGVCFSGFLPVAVGAQSAAKQTPARSVPVKKVFPFYDIYLGLPAQGRDGFGMEYILSGGAGSARPQMSYVLGNVRNALEIGPTGRILNMPDLAMLNTGRIEIAANQPRSGISMNLVPILPLSRVIGVPSATNPLTDYAAAVRRAGPLAAFAPKLAKIKFIGGTGGEATFADGRRIALPIIGGGAVFQPTSPALRGAVSLSFSTAPTDAQFAE